jgi:sterol desaturase/sphingolipid hydroxylase (fatty acid hydroxylase superfamily)
MEVDSPAESIARFRADYRAQEIPAGYRGGINLLSTFGGGSLALLACVMQLYAVEPLEWATLPLAFLYANLVEYLGHRFPMHRPYRGLGLIHRRHAGQHHRFFDHHTMALEGPRDLRAVLFPPLLVVFFFGGFALPAWWLLSWAVSDNVAWLMLATGIAYYLNYEFLHLAYHRPPQHWMARVPGVARLKWLHTVHHDPRRMAQCNFNITYPICDRLFGTLHRPPRD